MKKNFIFSISLLVIMIIFACSASYAYFTALFEYEKLASVQVTSGVMPLIIVEEFTDLEINITTSDMSTDNVDLDEPVKTESGTFKINTIMSEYGGQAEVFYEIYYEPYNVYERSLDNVVDNNGSYAKEFVISFTSKLNNVSEVVDLAGIDEKTLIYSDSFIVSGINTTEVEEVFTELEFYNQEFDQTENSGKSFGGTLTLEVIDVIYIVN